jgi:hypothetical protein
MATAEILKEPTVNGILILENAGGRIATKYFDSDLATKEAQLTFEEQLTEKVAAMPQGGPDALLFRDYVVMYKCYQDFRVFVVVRQTACCNLFNCAVHAVLLLKLPRFPFHTSTHIGHSRRKRAAAHHCLDDALRYDSLSSQEGAHVAAPH